jgi:capsid protein
MVGLNVLLRRGGVVVATGNFTLRHDRTLQPRVTADIEPWLAEFGGVLLSRATTPESMDAITLESLAELAHRRADRIACSLDNAKRACEACREELQDHRAWWQHSPTFRASCEALAVELHHVARVLSNLSRSGLDDALRSGELQRRVWVALTELRGTWT